MHLHGLFADELRRRDGYMNKLIGYSLIAIAKNAICMAITCEAYVAKFFANGAAAGGVLEHSRQDQRTADAICVRSQLRFLFECKQL